MTPFDITMYYITNCL